MIWKPKDGGTVSPGRLLHSLLAAFVVWWAGVRFGYGGAAWGLCAVLAGGILWEVATPVLGRWFGWAWLHGDLLDLVAFIVGGLVGSLGSIVGVRRRRGR